MQRVEQPIMTTGLERIAAKAREDRKLKFTSLAHHLTEKLIWESVCHIPKDSAPGCDEQTVTEAKESFKQWAPGMLGAIHNQGYRPPPILRVFIPKLGKKEKRPLGIPCVADRALQRSVAGVLAAIYEQDFLPCSFGGRPGIGAHHALGTLTEVIAGKPVSYVYEADLKNFFGSLDHGWLLRFLEHRVGDPRIMSLIRRWLKAGILEDGELTANEKGTPQGGSVTPLTQKITSSLSGRFLAGASSRWLILDARSIILMSHGAIHTSAKGAKAERRVSSDRASDECGRGCGDIGARGSDFIASRLSLSRSSRPPQATGGDRRAGATHHLQDLRQCHWRVARVCRRARFDVERGRHSRHHGVREACSPTCVSGMARAISVSNTPSIVCSPPNSNKSTSCSFPTACAALAKL